MRTRAKWMATVVVMWAAGGTFAQDGRVGFSEDFNTMDGWQAAGASLASMKSEGGLGVFETHIRNLPARMDGKPVCSRTFLELFPPGKPEVKYNTGRLVGYTADVSKDIGVVDLDRYHYLVMKCDDQPMGTWLELKLTDPATGRGGTQPVQVAHSTGIIAQDLKGLGIEGKKKVVLNLSMFQAGTCLKVDYIRFVSELTAEEKAGLIAAPVVLPDEKIAYHPYQKLEALYRRTPRPWNDLPDFATELACFHDVATGVPTWRMTATPAHEGLKGGDKPNVWRDDGSSMSTRGRTWHFARHAWGDEPGRHWTALKAAKREDYIIAGDKNARKWVFRKRDAQGDGSTVICEHPWPPDRPSYRTEVGVFGNRLVAAMIGSHVVVVDVPEDGGQPKVNEYPLPPIGAKGVWMNEKTLSYWAPFLSVHRINVDLDTGTITDGVHHTWTHGMSGPDWSIMAYDSISKVVLSPEGKRSATPGKEIQIYGIYKSRISTDYGEMTSDSRYGITNGTKGELARQYVLFDRMDAGTVLRLCTWNVSYATWDLRAKVKASPDYTKLAYGSDMLGDADQYMTIMRIPSAPRNLKLAGNRLSWDAPAVHAEVARYNVYRSTKSGGPYELIATVKEPTFTDRERIAGACYVVAAEEHSELESYFSNEVRPADHRGPVTVHFEAELQKAEKPWREVVDGTAAGLRALRVTPVRARRAAASSSCRPTCPKGTTRCGCARVTGGAARARWTTCPTTSRSAARSLQSRWRVTPGAG